MQLVVTADALSSGADTLFYICYLFIYLLLFITGQRRAMHGSRDLDQIFHNDVVGTSHEPHGVQSEISCPKPE
jgi:hypothetical protein